MVSSYMMDQMTSTMTTISYLKDGEDTYYILQFIFARRLYISVFVEPADERPRMIFEQTLKITNEQSNELRTWSAGAYYDWAPNFQTYFPQAGNSRASPVALK